jgi:hypothetical protein
MPAVWTQDRFRELVASVTTDRGRSWRRVAIPELVPFTLQLGDGFGRADTLADGLLRIGVDEGMQKLGGPSPDHRGCPPARWIMTSESRSRRGRLVLGVGRAVMSRVTERAECLDEREQQRRRATPGAVGTAGPTTSGRPCRDPEHEALLADSVGRAPDGSRRS